MLCVPEVVGDEYRQAPQMVVFSKTSSVAQRCGMRRHYRDLLADGWHNTEAHRAVIVCGWDRGLFEEM